MSDSLHTDPEQQLIERLRREAAQCRPRFSEELHRRICRAIAEQAEQPPTRFRRGWWTGGWQWTILGAGAAVAAGITLLGTAMLLGWVHMDQPPVRPEPVPIVRNGSRVPAEHLRSPAQRDRDLVFSSPNAPKQPEQGHAPKQPQQTPAEVPLLAEEAAARVGLLVDATLDRPRWAYLDHDLRLGAELLVERLPWELVLAERALPDEEPR